ncbi:hypothetical protein ACFWHQ_08330 [Streptomyces sp. NPDC060334]|uniref:hypothetical protein n=1 Tax=unclassified Streptomyces TaxID=2593676 RepID=UPI0036606F8C
MFDSDISEDIAADLTADFSADIEDDSGADHTRDFGADFARVLATDNTRDFGADFGAVLATDKDLRSTRDPWPSPSLVRTGDGGAAFMFETQSGRESVREDRHSWL